MRNLAASTQLLPCSGAMVKHPLAAVGAIQKSRQRIRFADQSKGHNGKRTNNNCIYGYLKNPNDKTKWIVDPEAATVVQRIFAMSVEGKGPHQIAKALEADKIEMPSVYLARQGVVTQKIDAIKHPCCWSPATVASILRKLEYVGHTVNFRTTKESYKSRKQTHNPQEEWVIFDNTHEAIVDPQTWQMAQRCRTVKRRTDTGRTMEPS